MFGSATETLDVEIALCIWLFAVAAVIVFGFSVSGVMLRRSEWKYLEDVSKPIPPDKVNDPRQHMTMMVDQYGNSKFVLHPLGPLPKGGSGTAPPRSQRRTTEWQP